MVDVKHRERLPGAKSILKMAEVSMQLLSCTHSSPEDPALILSIRLVICLRPEVVQQCVIGSAKRVQDAKLGRQESTSRVKLLVTSESASTVRPNTPACSFSVPFGGGQQQGPDVEFRAANGFIGSGETPDAASSAAPADRCATSGEWYSLWHISDCLAVKQYTSHLDDSIILAF